jgi:hypothetical protein
MRKSKACSAACQTKDHKTWGECIRSKGISIGPNLMGATENKRGERELQAYRDAKSQGINPDGTTMAKVEEAVRISNETGVAYGS